MSGNLGAAAVGAVTLAINATALGPAQFGVLALVQAFVLVCERFFGFDTWQPFTRAISQPDIEAQPARFRSAAVTTLKYDGAASLAGGIFALVVVLIFTERLQLRPDDTMFAAVYVATLFVRFPGVPIGLLRFEGRFAWQAKLQIVEACAKLGISLVLAENDAEIGSYFLCFAGVSVFHQLALWSLAHRAWRLSTRLPQVPERGPVDAGEARIFAGFSFATWVHSSSNVLRQNADIFVLGAFGWTEAVAFYVIAQRVAGLMARVADAARLAVFPEISVLVGSGNSALALVALRRSAPYSLALLVVPPVLAWFMAEPLVRLFLGDAYTMAATPMFLLVVAQSIYLAGFAIGPLVQLVVSPTSLLRMTVPAFLVSMAAMLLLIPRYGLNGAGVSQIVFNVIWFTAGLVIIRRSSIGKS